MNEPLLESYYSGIFENKSEIKISGWVVGYTSEELKKFFIEELKHNNYFSAMTVKKIEQEIRKAKLIPVYSSEHWLSDIFDTFFWVFRAMSGIMIGFYDGKNMYIMIASLRNLDGSIPKKEIFTIITHEYQHLLANKKSNYSKHMLVKKTLRTFYKSFIIEYFGPNISNEAIITLSKFWLNIQAEYNKNIADVIENRLKEFTQIIEKLKIKETSDIVEKMDILHKYVIDCYHSRNPSSFMPFNVARNVYNKQFNIESNTFAYQEFIIASEVCAIVFSNIPRIGNQMLTTFI